MSTDTKPNYLEPVPLVRVILLYFIKINPATTGYTLINLINDFSQNTVELRTGTAYNELRKMEKLKFVSSQQDDSKRKKRSYFITEEGNAELERLMQNIESRVNLVLLPLLHAYKDTEKQ